MLSTVFSFYILIQELQQTSVLYIWWRQKVGIISRDLRDSSELANNELTFYPHSDTSRHRNRFQQLQGTLLRILTNWKIRSPQNKINVLENLIRKSNFRPLQDETQRKGSEKNIDTENVKRRYFSKKKTVTYNLIFNLFKQIIFFLNLLFWRQTTLFNIIYMKVVEFYLTLILINNSNSHFLRSSSLLRPCKQLAQSGIEMNFLFRFSCFRRYTTESHCYIILSVFFLLKTLTKKLFIYLTFDEICRYS